MKALVLKQDKILEYVDVPEPDRPGDAWALISVAHAGICGSDILRGFDGGAYHYPLIMGHEFSGIVQEPGKGGKFAKGARVTVFPLIPCRKCEACRSGDFAQCADYDYLGSRRDGAFAERVWAPEENLLPVPDTVSMREAALVEPCAVALHGVGKLAVRPGDIGAVFGAGPVGNMAAQWMRLRGCADIFLVDVEDGKLELARTMGFHAVDARRHDPVEFIKEKTGGHGADRVVEAVGLPSTFLQAIKTAARFGQVLFMGNIRGSFEMGEKDFSSILRREIAILGTWNSRAAPEGRNEWTTVLSRIGRGIDVASLVSHTPKLSEGPAVFHRIREKREFFNKVVFES